MNNLRALIDTSPVPPEISWAPVVTADTLSTTVIGGLGGMTVGALVVEPLAHPGELDAVNTAEAGLQTAQNTQANDQQLLDGVSKSLGADNVYTGVLRNKVAEDQAATTQARQQLEALPNHNNALTEEGAAIGVGIGLVAAGVKLGVRFIRTRRAQR